MSVKQIDFVNDLLDSAAADSLPRVIFFHTDWAEQCKAMESVVQELAVMFRETARFLKVNAEALPEVSSRFNVKAVPCFIILNAKDETLTRIEGAKSAELLAALQDLARPVNVDQKCDQLIASHPLMLFIKGTPESPRCGFTSQLLALLRANGLSSFGYYNILEDEPVRQHLKTKSQWPTYPQVYLKGDLLGGLDILKEMQASGELARIAAAL